MYRYGFYGFINIYSLLLMASIIFSMYASRKVKSSYERFSLVRGKTGLTGEQVAKRLLSKNGITYINVVPGRGILTDHYNHSTEIISLSEGVFSSNSISAIAIAAHEVGHAIQKNRGYSFFKFRDAIAGPAQFASKTSWMMIVIGILLTRTAYITQANLLIDIGIILFATITLFHLITLPVELNASRRALEELSDSGIIFEDEKPAVKSVLSGAAMTYVAALSVSLVQLLRVLAIRDRN